MDMSALIIVIFGTSLFFGFALWMAFYSRRKPKGEQARDGQPENIGEPKSVQRQQ